MSVAVPQSSTYPRAGAYEPISEVSHRDIFVRAVRYTQEQGGDAAVARAFEDPGPLDRLWELPTDEFRRSLWRLVTSALSGREGSSVITETTKEVSR